KTDYSFTDPRLKELNSYSTKLIKELIIPKLTKEVNSSKRYASLRQVYYSLIMAQWFKARYHSQNTDSSLRVSAQHERSNLDSNLVNLIDSKNLSNLTSKTSWNKQDYFNQYQHSFAKGEYNTKETVYTPTGQVIRSYMSGGIKIMPEGIIAAGSPLNKTASAIVTVPSASSSILGGRPLFKGLILATLMAGSLVIQGDNIQRQELQNTATVKPAIVNPQPSTSSFSIFKESTLQEIVTSYPSVVVYGSPIPGIIVHSFSELIATMKANGGLKEQDEQLALKFLQILEKAGVPIVLFNNVNEWGLHIGEKIDPNNLRLLGHPFAMVSKPGEGMGIMMKGYRPIFSSMRLAHEIVHVFQRSIKSTRLRSSQGRDIFLETEHSDSMTRLYFDKLKTSLGENTDLSKLFYGFLNAYTNEPSGADTEIFAYIYQYLNAEEDNNYIDTVKWKRDLWRLNLQRFLDRMDQFSPETKSILRDYYSKLGLPIPAALGKEQKSSASSSAVETELVESAEIPERLRGGKVKLTHLVHGTNPEALEKIVFVDGGHLISGLSGAVFFYSFDLSNPDNYKISMARNTVIKNNTARRGGVNLEFLLAKLLKINPHLRIFSIGETQSFDAVPLAGLTKESKQGVVRILRERRLMKGLDFTLEEKEKLCGALGYQNWYGLSSDLGIKEDTGGMAASSAIEDNDQSLPDEEAGADNEINGNNKEGSTSGYWLNINNDNQLTRNNVLAFPGEARISVGKYSYVFSLNDSLIRFQSFETQENGEVVELEPAESFSLPLTVYCGRSEDAEAKYVLRRHYLPGNLFVVRIYYDGAGKLVINVDKTRHDFKVDVKLNRIETSEKIIEISNEVKSGKSSLEPGDMISGDGLEDDLVITGLTNKELRFVAVKDGKTEEFTMKPNALINPVKKGSALAHRLQSEDEVLKLNLARIAEEFVDEEPSDTKRINGVMDSEGKIVAFGDIKSLRIRVKDFDYKVQKNELLLFSILISRNTKNKTINLQLDSLGDDLQQSGFSTIAIQRLAKSLNDASAKLSASSALEENKISMGDDSSGKLGGIDFRSLPIVTQAASNLGLNTMSQELRIKLMNFNLSSELNEIERLTNAGITPSTQRIKEYIQASSISTNSPEDNQKLLSCIADILRKQEEECCVTDPTLKDLLVVLEAGIDQGQS
ncbi:MAG: hypothetical protein HZC15_07320, partial [Candidatus Omnitrophica bacterium]|nr:hypothetical protein [Candidatus Omnitrophota bacterium]